jgi:hypothetical protein
MNQSRHRQLARLESAHLKRRRQLADAARVNQSELEALPDRALTRLANVSLLILYGDPRIDEPLSQAWERCRTSREWLSYIQKCGGWDEHGGNSGGSLFQYAQENWKIFSQKHPA